MRVKVLLDIEVEPLTPDYVADKHDIHRSIREAIRNAIESAESWGYNHTLDDSIALQVTEITTL